MEATEKKYKNYGGISFDERTPDEVCRVLATASISGRTQRLKLYYGDTETGRDWHEEFDTTGYIGRSTGTYKIPLLIPKKNSIGGGAILDHCIVKIKDIRTGIVLYQHPKYQVPKVEITEGDMKEYPYNTIVNGKTHGRHKSLRSAKIIKNKLS